MRNLPCSLFPALLAGALLVLSPATMVAQVMRSSRGILDSQSKDTVIVVDMFHVDDFLTTYKYSKVEKGTRVTMKVINVNPGIYTVTVSASASSSYTAIPDQLLLASLVLPALPSNGGRFAPRSQALRDSDLFWKAKWKNCPEVFRKLETLQGAYQMDSARVNGFFRLIAFNQWLVAEIKDCRSTQAATWNRIIDRLRADFRADVDDTSPVEKIDKRVRELVEKMNGAPAAFLSRRQALRRTLADLEQGSACADKTDLSLLKQDLQDQLQAATDDYEVVLDFFREAKVTELLANIHYFQEENFTVVAHDTARRADQIRFDVSIKPKGPVPCTYVSKDFSLVLAVRRWKIDFSSGVFINGGGKRFAGNNYFITAAGKIDMIRNSNMFVVPSLGALMHVYHQSGNLVDGGFVVGASLTTELKYSNLHAGLSAMFNTRNEIFGRLCVSGGLTLRYANKLSRDYRVGDDVDSNLTIDQLEVGSFQPGLFFALTYNITR